MPEIGQYLSLVRNHNYPLVKDFIPLGVSRWEENLLYSRRTSKPELQELIDQHLISIIWGKRLNVFNPLDFVRREEAFRRSDLPPTARFFELSFTNVYEQLIKEAKDKKLEENVQFLEALKEQFEEILRSTGMFYERELGDTLRDILSQFQRYPIEEELKK